MRPDPFQTVNQFLGQQADVILRGLELEKMHARIARDAHELPRRIYRACYLRRCPLGSIAKANPNLLK